MKIRVLVFSAIIAASLVACAKKDNNHIAFETINPQQLINYDWFLNEATDINGRPVAALSKDTKLKLQFNGQRLNVSGGCNSIGSNYQLNGKFLQLDTPMSTMMACSPDLMAQDAAIAKLMNGQKLNIGLIKSTDNRPKLLIQSKNGDHLSFSGVQTATSKYGQPTVVFWEISNKTRTCEAAQGKKECLQVRDVTYDDQGIKIKNGVWRNFDGEIEGWQLNPNENQVLRLNVYQSNTTDASNSHYVYKLDQIIERTIVKRQK
ncbi:MAG: META and DUF4377 domain-containing protein [Snodgrassella sp.]|nr:META and DUF4377 domain-containing protein [Snodgrassella sp.]